MPPTLIPGTVSTGLIFAFIYLNILCLHHAYLPTLFAATSPTMVPTTPPLRQNLFHLLFSDFVEEKA
jgi:hypothetical protein